MHSCRAAELCVRAGCVRESNSRIPCSMWLTSFLCAHVLQRIVGALPTIKHALEKGAKSVVLCSHMGRPKVHARGGVSCVISC